MVHVFTTNKNGKIELTKEELKNLLDESYWDGYKANTGIFSYHSPYVWTNTTSNTCTLNTSSMPGGTLSASNNVCESH